MPFSVLAAVAGLAAVAHLGRKGSAAGVPKKNKKKMIDLVKNGRVSEARALALELGLDRLDLSYADLSGADLPRANLTGANLTGASLSFANLTGANLTGANLSFANLTGANLPRANLSNADLTGANLSNANLSDTHLADSDLSNANLAGTNLKGAFITDTTGINIGPNRTFIGIPYDHIETKSNLVPGRTNLRRK